jgi:hypothetical protein
VETLKGGRLRGSIIYAAAPYGAYLGVLEKHAAALGRDVIGQGGVGGPRVAACPVCIVIQVAGQRLQPSTHLCIRGHKDIARKG